MKIRLTIFAIFVSTVAYTQSSTTDLELIFKDTETTVPISYRSRANPVIEVMVNGKGPYKFMFDTGAAGEARIDISLFEELNLSVTDSIMAGDGSGQNTRWLPVTKLNTITIGSYTIRNPRAMVRNYNTKSGIDKIDGVLGLNFFEHVLLSLSFEKNQLNIRKAKLDPKAKGIIPFTFDRGVPVISGKLNNKKIDITFDLGNMGGLTFHENDIPKDIMSGEPKVVGRAQTVSNSFEIKEVQLSVPVQIGELTFNNPMVTLNGMIPHANAGVRFARQLNVTFDLTNKLMQIEKFISTPGAASSTSNKLHEYTGRYEGERVVSLGEDGFLYIQRGGGTTLKMIEKKPGEFYLEAVAHAVLVFERDATGNVIAIKTSRDDGKIWEVSNRN